MVPIGGWSGVIVACSLPCLVAACGSSPDSPAAGASGGGASNSSGGASGSSTGGSSASGGTSQSGGASPGGGNAGTASGGAGGLTSSGGAGGVPAGDDAGVARPGLDLYVLFDQSLSMTCTAAVGTRYQTAGEGLAAFGRSLNGSNAGVGLQFWPRGPVGGASCVVSDYAAADVEFGKFPANQVAIEDAVAAHQPTGASEPAPALSAGIDHAKAWQAAHTDRRAVVVLVADGITGTAGPVCTSLDVVDIARSGYAAGISTYVIGLMQTAGDPTCTDVDPTVKKTAFDAVAAAGGTTEALIVDPVSVGPTGVLNALQTILTHRGP